ncbi:unnamed protein product, partial [Mesorhabditis belari]|uniref:lysozyme n=1 Tax=Mesorhabditis belari TaxID=2138241 RepID=A0AAF3EBX4_9BILA
MLLKLNFLLFFLFFANAIEAVCNTTQVRDEILRYVDRALSKVNPRLPPNDGPTEVRVYFEIARFIYYDSFKTILNFEAFFGLFWHDPQLNFTHVPCFTDSSFSPKLTEKIWTPNIRFFDLIGKNEQTGLENAQLYILKDGRIHLLQKIALTAPCVQNISNGTTDCTIDFGSDEHDADQMDLDFKDFHQVDPSASLPDQRLYDITYEKLKEDYLGLTFDTLRLHLHFEDVSGHKIKYYFFPMYVLVVLSWMGFFLGKNTTARVILGLSILFAMCLLHNTFFVIRFPKVSHIFFADFFLFIFTSFVVMTFVVLVIGVALDENRAAYNEEKPSKIRRFFYNYTAKFIDWAGFLLKATMYKLLLVAALVAVTTAADTCIHCICLHESGCKAIGCHQDVGSLSCGYYQIKLPYYEDCGQPGKKSGESTETAWKRCSDDYSCSTTCVNNYFKRYEKNCAGKGFGTCEQMSRLHNGGPSGCSTSATVNYWNAIHKCCACS